MEVLSPKEPWPQVLVRKPNYLGINEEKLVDKSCSEIIYNGFSKFIRDTGYKPNIIILGYPCYGRLRSEINHMYSVSCEKDGVTKVFDTRVVVANGIGIELF